MRGRPKKKLELLSVRQAAIELGITRAAVYGAVASGRLEAIEVDTFIVLQPSAVQAFKELRQKAGKDE
ncbi:MAG: hypothetical protein JWQ02_1032 [Capsulimonas sp.]|nr:hypothetical protein [Capsulimonas sp.]